MHSEPAGKPRGRSKKIAAVKPPGMPRRREAQSLGKRAKDRALTKGTWEKCQWGIEREIEDVDARGIGGRRVGEGRLVLAAGAIAAIRRLFRRALRRQGFLCRAAGMDCRGRLSVPGIAQKLADRATTRRVGHQNGQQHGKSMTEHQHACQSSTRWILFQ